MKIIIYKSIDGGFLKISPSLSTPIESNIKFVPKGAEYKIIDDSEFPDRTFEEAWELVEGEVKVNLEKFKLLKTREIKLAYQGEMETGKCDTGLGYFADNRTKNTSNGLADVAIIEGALLAEETSYFKDADDEIHLGTTNQDFITMLAAMRVDLTMKILKKHSLLAAIETASLEELGNIKW